MGSNSKGGKSTRPTVLRGIQEGMIQLVGARQVEILLVGISLRGVLLRGTHILIELKHVSIIMNMIERCQLTRLSKNPVPLTLVTCVQASSHPRDLLNNMGRIDKRRVGYPKTIQRTLAPQ